MNSSITLENNAAPASATSDSAWVSIPVPQDTATLAELCSDIEALFRTNPYLTFQQWKQTGDLHYDIAFKNDSNEQELTTALDVVIESRTQFVMQYSHGIKKRTIFTIEPAEQGSKLIITDDYAAGTEIGDETANQAADKSLHAWGVGLQTYFKRIKRWSWLPGWRWYLRRVWIPMKPSARRIVWLIFLITTIEFFFFLFVMLIYVLEQHNS